MTGRSGAAPSSFKLTGAFGDDARIVGTRVGSADRNAHGHLTVNMMRREASKDSKEDDYQMAINVAYSQSNGPSAAAVTT